jgi:hypothetical protein
MHRPSQGELISREKTIGGFPMAFDLELCEAVYEALGRDENLRAYRAYLRHRAWQLVQNSLDGDEIGLACLRDASSTQARRGYLT